MLSYECLNFLNAPKKKKQGCYGPLGAKKKCVPVTFHFHALEKEMATHSSVLAWRIPGTGEPGGLPSMGSHSVGHDWSDLAAAAAGCFHVTVAELSNCNRDHLAYRVKNIYCLALYGKSLLTPALNHITLEFFGVDFYHLLREATLWNKKPTTVWKGQMSSSLCWSRLFRYKILPAF